MRKLLVLLGVSLALVFAASAGAVQHNMPVADGYACHAPYNLGDPNWYPVGSTYPYRITGNYTVVWFSPTSAYGAGAYNWEPNSFYCGWQTYAGNYAWIMVH